MKKKTIVLSIIICFATLSLFAQEKEKINSNEIRTLAGNNITSNGFYAGLSFGYSQIDQKDAFLSNVRLAWIINHNFAIGVAGSGFVSDLDHYYDVPGDQFALTGGHAGLFLEPIFFAKNPIHISMPIIIGMGGIYAWNESDYNPQQWEHNTYDYHEDWDAYFVIEPGLELDINVVRFMRLSLGATYRITDDIQMNHDDNIALSKDALRNISGYFTLKFGKF